MKERDGSSTCRGSTAADDEEAVYSLAFNDSASYRRQWQEIPQVVKERLHMSVIFADKKGNIVEL